MPPPNQSTEKHRARCVQLRKLGKFDEAQREILLALRINPKFPEGHYNLAAIHFEQGRLEDAVKSWRAAIDCRPQYFQAYSSLAVALRRLGRHEEAIAAARRGIEIRPDHVESHLALATALHAARRFDEAADEFELTLELDPRNVLALNNYGNLLADRDRPHSAATKFRAALDVDPSQVEVMNNLANVFKAQAHINQAIEYFRRALHTRPNLPHVHSNLLLTLNAHPGSDQGLLDEHIQWAERHAAPLYPTNQEFKNERSTDRRLRVGYVSADMRRHSVAYFFEPLIQSHDHENFEIYCYSNTDKPDDVTQRIRSRADHWRPIVGMSDQRVAQLVREDGIDILVDLSGHTAHNRLLVFARKPAPMQVTYLGYPNTTGLATMDYRLTDAQADPPGMTDSQHTETLVRLPHGFLCYQPVENAPDVQLPTSEITFGTFNNFAKVTREMIAVWSRILREVPDSMILIKAETLGDDETRREVRTMFAENGVHESRVELLGREPSFLKHLATYHRVHIGLDTFPYHGTTTTCEAMWMGVPVVTLAGHAHVSRVGVSLLTRVGLSEMIAQGRDEYVKIASQLARDVDRLRHLKLHLRQRMARSALMDRTNFARSVESAYRTMWRDWIGKS